jgi:hypothetical protein
VKWSPASTASGSRPATGDFDLHWDEREELLDLVRATPGSEKTIDRFRDVGASAPVELTDEQKALIVSTVEATMGASEALHELQHAFIDELERVAA